jgi:hypothetical protein
VNAWQDDTQCEKYSLLPKQAVAGSSPVPRSIRKARKPKQPRRIRLNARAANSWLWHVLDRLDTNRDTNVSGGGAVTDDEPIRITIPRDRDARPEADYWQALIDGEWVRVAGVRLVHEKPVAEKMSYSIAVEYVGQPSSSGSDAP